MDKESALEALLFIASEPTAVKKLSKAINTDIDTTKILLSKLKYKYESESRGVGIIIIDDKYQMCTNPKYHEYIKKMYSTKENVDLSQASLETLAIIAYKQPITKIEIEHIRGVSVSHTVNKLIDYNLIEEKGRLEQAGKPILFGTTDEFLKFFGITKLEELPDLFEIQKTKDK